MTYSTPCATQAVGETKKQQGKFHIDESLYLSCEWWNINKKGVTFSSPKETWAIVVALMNQFLEYE